MYCLSTTMLLYLVIDQICLCLSSRAYDRHYSVLFSIESIPHGLSFRAEYFTTFASGPELVVDFDTDAGDIIAAVVADLVGSGGSPLIIREPFKSTFTQVGC